MTKKLLGGARRGWWRRCFHQDVAETQAGVRRCLWSHDYVPAPGGEPPAMVTSAGGNPEKIFLTLRTKKLQSGERKASDPPEQPSLPEGNWGIEPRSPSSRLASCISPGLSCGCPACRPGAQPGVPHVSSFYPWKSQSLIGHPRQPCKPIMLTEDMKLWHGLAIAAVSLILQACLFTAIGYLLSRHMAKESERLLKGARLQAPEPSPAHHQPLAAKEETPSISVSEPRYRHHSDTSSGSSDSSDSSGSSSPACQATKNMNYAQVVFSTTKGLKNESALDYENIKETTDYVNVNPKSHKPNSWTFAKPADSEPVEYTQVAL